MQDNWMPFCRRITLSLIIASFGLGSFAVAKDRVQTQTVAEAVASPAPEAQTSPVVMETGNSGRNRCAADFRPWPEHRFPVITERWWGQFEVTALFDGTLDFHPELLKNMDRQAIDRALSHHYGRTTGIQTAINAYLIHTGDHLVLIDAGAGKLFSEDRQGRIVENLRAAGYQPEQVDTVIMTHLHGDHTGGLSDREGIQVFPNATVYANRIENEYWLSEQQGCRCPG